MKKIFTILAVAVVMLTGCKQTSDFNKYLVSDYELVKGEFPEQEVVFYEAQVTLSGSPAELGKKAQPVTVKEVFQVTDTAVVVFIDRNYTDGTYKMEKLGGYWLEDVAVNPEGLADYNDALKTLLNAKDVTVPDSNLMTLRNPLGPTIYENPFYIFGSTHTSFVGIDAKTLEISFIEVPESRLKTEE